MDSVCEIVFLRAIEGRKGVLGSKQMSKECRAEKKKAWDEVKHHVLEQTGRDFNESQMIKKWQNIQTRVKDKIKDGKRTGGGGPKVLGEADQLCCRILGEDNPKLQRIPGGRHNTAEITTNEPVVTEGIEDKQTPASSSNKRKSTIRDEQSLDDLHREVLMLQKEKLRLSIKKLKAEVEPDKEDKGTQTTNGIESFGESPIYYTFD